MFTYHCAEIATLMEQFFFFDISGGTVFAAAVSLASLRLSNLTPPPPHLCS